MSKTGTDVHIRLEPAEARALRALARAEDRTLQSVARMLMRLGLAAYRAEKEGKSK